MAVEVGVGVGVEVGVGVVVVVEVGVGVGVGVGVEVGVGVVVVVVVGVGVGVVVVVVVEVGSNKMKTPKITADIFIFDVETSPILGYSWEKWFPSGGRLLKVVKDRQLLCASGAWYNADGIEFKRVRKYGDDANVAKWLRKQWHKADLIVAHNGVKCDKARSRTRMMAGNKHKPDSNPPVVDTLRFASQHCGFTGNSLDDLLEFFGHAKKKKVDFDMWLDCMAGKKQGWKKMRRYNMQDVRGLKLLLTDFIPWMLQLPTYRRLLLTPKARCVYCKSRLLQSRGKSWTCMECGKWWRKS